MYPPEPTDELLGVLHLATELANQFGHAEVLPEHVLMSLMRTPSAGRALTIAGADLPSLAVDLRDYLARTATPTKRWQLLGPSYALSLRRLLDAVMKRLVASFRREIGVADVLDAVLKADSLSARDLLAEASVGGAVYREGRHVVVHPIERLRQAGFRHVDALAWMAHGDLMRATPAPGGDDDVVATILYDDDFTDFHWVEKVLREEFAMTEADATSITNEVHRVARLLIDRGPRAPANARVQRIIAASRAAGHPLLLTVDDRET